MNAKGVIVKQLYFAKNEVVPKLSPKTMKVICRHIKAFLETVKFDETDFTTFCNQNPDFKEVIDHGFED